MHRTLASAGGRVRPDTGRTDRRAQALLAVLDEVRALLQRPGNDFTWSSFADAEAAVGEIDELGAAVRAGRVPFALDVLFAPTGPIQEVAISSGWGHEFLILADRFDAARAAADDTPSY